MTWLKYVVHAKVDEWKSLGWIVADDFAGTPHGFYAVLMQWPFETEPVLP